MNANAIAKLKPVQKPEIQKQQRSEGKEEKVPGRRGAA